MLFYMIFGLTSMLHYWWDSRSISHIFRVLLCQTITYFGLIIWMLTSEGHSLTIVFLKRMFPGVAVWIRIRLYILVFYSSYAAYSECPSYAAYPFYPLYAFYLSYAFYPFYSEDLSMYWSTRNTRVSFMALKT